jgi:hypothetical protein
VQNDTHLHWAKFAQFMVSKALTRGFKAAGGLAAMSRGRRPTFGKLRDFLEKMAGISGAGAIAALCLSL